MTSVVEPNFKDLCSFAWIRNIIILQILKFMMLILPLHSLGLLLVIVLSLEVSKILFQKEIFPWSFQNGLLKVKYTDTNQWSAYCWMFYKCSMVFSIFSHVILQCIIFSIFSLLSSQHAWKPTQRSLGHSLLPTSLKITLTTGNAFTGSQWKPATRLHCTSQISPWRRLLVQNV